MPSYYDLAVKIDEKETDVKEMLIWLTNVMFFINPIIPTLETEQHVHNYILSGHAVIVFMHQYHEQVLRICDHFIANHPEQIKLNPEPFIRLPLFVSVYKEFVEPVFQEATKQNLAALNERMPEYYEKLDAII